MVKFKIEGIKQINMKLKKLGEVPQKSVALSSRKGMSIALKAAKQGGWVDQSGEMRRGMKLIGEKSKIKGKKVYQVVFDKNKNDIFQKQVINPIRGKKTAYYPASQEYGFYARDGRYIPGFHFMKKALVDNKGAIQKKIIDEMSKQIDKVLEEK